MGADDAEMKNENNDTYQPPPTAMATRWEQLEFGNTIPQGTEDQFGMDTDVENVPLRDLEHGTFEPVLQPQV